MHGVTKRCRLSWLTNSALMYETKCGGMGGGGCGFSANKYSCAHGAHINIGDLTPYLTYEVNTFLNLDSERDCRIRIEIGRKWYCCKGCSIRIQIVNRNLNLPFLSFFYFQRHPLLRSCKAFVTLYAIRSITNALLQLYTKKKFYVKKTLEIFSGKPNSSVQELDLDPDPES